MSKGIGLLVLLLAATLEAGGDALVRTALHRTSRLEQAAFFVLGAGVLFLYGLTVNAPAWDFGKLLGLYVVFFFVSAQAIGWIFFKQVPPTGVFVGGSLIVAGGIVIAMVR